MSWFDAFIATLFLFCVAVAIIVVAFTVGILAASVWDQFKYRNKK